MADLTHRAQNVVQILVDLWNSVPIWLALVILFAPTLVSLITRSRVTIFSTALLSTACLVALVAGNSSNSAVPVAIATFSAALILAAYGLHERRLWQTLITLEARVSHVDEQLMTFLNALERRSDMIDETAEEARRTFEEAGKQVHKTFTAFPQAPRTTASVGDRSGSPEAETTVPSPYSSPPELKT